MGCCVTKPSTPQNHPPLPKRQSTSPPRPPSPPSPEPPVTHSHDNARPRTATAAKTTTTTPPHPPPPPPIEEESVKEVLSETPLPRSHLSIAQAESEPTPVPNKLREDAPDTQILISKLQEVADVVSEYSDMYSVSVSGSLSTTTASATTGTTLTDKRDNDVTSGFTARELKQRRRPKVGSPAKPPRRARNHSPAGEITGKERRVGSRSPSPARRVRPPPEKKSFTGGSGPARTPQRNAGPSCALRRESGESSRRRSNSPAARRAGEVWVGGMATGDAKAAGGNAGESETKVAGEEGQSDDDGVAYEGANEESVDLDNPHVSLECFIFL